MRADQPGELPVDGECPLVLERELTGIAAPRMGRRRRLHEVQQLLGDPVDVDGQRDAAVHDHGEADLALGRVVGGAVGGARRAQPRGLPAGVPARLGEQRRPVRTNPPAAGQAAGRGQSPSDWPKQPVRAGCAIFARRDDGRQRTTPDSRPTRGSCPARWTAEARACRSVARASPSAASRRRTPTGSRCAGATCAAT
jgi:hypothetical protein